MDNLEERTILCDCGQELLRLKFPKGTDEKIWSEAYKGYACTDCLERGETVMALTIQDSDGKTLSTLDVNVKYEKSLESTLSDLQLQIDELKVK